MKRHVNIEPYWGPVGGWGSARAVGEILLREGRPVEGPMTLAEQNKPSGFACVSCSYAKPGEPKFLEFCENGAKATAWEITSSRCGPDFFDAHTVTELEKWSDHGLEEVGRLTEPMRYDRETDKYLPVEWEDAFTQIGEALRGFDRPRRGRPPGQRADVGPRRARRRTAARPADGVGVPPLGGTLGQAGGSASRGRGVEERDVVAASGLGERR